MTNEANYLDIVLLGKEYRVACPPEERDALSAAAAHVSATMDEITEQTRSNSPERVAVMAALNIAHELLMQRSATSTPDDFSQTMLDFAQAKRRIQAMEAQIDTVLPPQEDLF
ncbi:cell division protein ZapA [Dentiradicibacter hellwigii]|uniref:Cell division protein ZapA n=1 Tax=Dentiradicibacter hellwigii TaxID=3149053 RepID=A0ABV4UFI8_9RHOO